MVEKDVRYFGFEERDGRWYLSDDEIKRLIASEFDIYTHDMAITRVEWGKPALINWPANVVIERGGVLYETDLVSLRRWGDGR